MVDHARTDDVIILADWAVLSSHLTRDLQFTIPVSNAHDTCLFWTLQFSGLRVMPGNWAT